MGVTDETTHSLRRPRGQLIVIIDDDESMQDALRDLIESTGLVARCFGSAEAFLESDLHRSAACVIADIRMPKMSGLELQARLKKEGCDIPIIFNFCLRKWQDADSSDERWCSRVPYEAIRSSLAAQNGPGCT